MRAWPIQRCAGMIQEDPVSLSLPNASKLDLADASCPKGAVGLGYLPRRRRFAKCEAEEAALKLSYGPSRAFLLAAGFLCGAATTLAQTDTPQSSSTPGQATPGTQGVSPFAGSVPAKLVPGVLSLSLQDAIDRGLKQNLGALLSNAEIGSARGQRWEQLSALLPHLTSSPYLANSKINLAELGITSIAGATIPPADGPFSYFDARISLTQ